MVNTRSNKKICLYDDVVVGVHLCSGCDVINITMNSISYVILKRVILFICDIRSILKLSTLFCK